MPKILSFARLALAALVLSSAAPARAAVVAFSGPNQPSLNVFGSGKATNLLESEGTLTVGLMHAGWSLAVPLLGEKFGGRKGLWVAGVAWMVASVVEQSMFHAPARPAEVRSGLLTKLVPCGTLLAIDLFRHEF